jgi:hypothetical protein
MFQLRIRMADNQGNEEVEDSVLMLAGGAHPQVLHQIGKSVEAVTEADTDVWVISRRTVG